MRLAVITAAVLAACSSSPPAPAPGPVRPATVAEPPSTAPPAEYSCMELGARPVSVNLKVGYTAGDIAAWLIAWSCRAVVVPSHLQARSAQTGFSELVEARELPRVLDQLLAEIGLVAVTADRITVFVEADPRLQSGRPELIVTPGPGPDPRPEPSANPLGAVADLGNGRYQITRDAFERALANPTAFARGARIVPSVKNGKPNGFKLYAIRPSSIFARLGLMNGDTLHRINGHEISTPEKALEVYARLRDATEIRVELSRRGQPTVLTYEIR